MLNITLLLFAVAVGEWGRRNQTQIIYWEVIWRMWRYWFLMPLHLGSYNSWNVPWKSRQWLDVLLLVEFLQILLIWRKPFSWSTYVWRRRNIFAGSPFFLGLPWAVNVVEWVLFRILSDSVNFKVPSSEYLGGLACRKWLFQAAAFTRVAVTLEEFPFIYFFWGGPKRKFVKIKVLSTLNGNKKCN